MMLTAFTITELSVALVSVIAACGICMRQSRCDQIQMPCCSVHCYNPKGPAAWGFNWV